MVSPERSSLVSSDLTPAWLKEKAPLLRSALISDALDELGYRNQCLSSALMPLSIGDFVVGTAFPVQIRTVNEVPEEPYLGLLAAVDAVGEGDVYIAAVDGEGDVAIWGELITTACRARGAVGSVCDGYARDTPTLRSMEFPVFCRGTVPTDSNGRSEVVAHGVTITIDGVSIDAGDHIVADDDGVVIVPRAISAQVFQKALDKGESESDFRRAVAAGMSAVEAFRTFGVL